ncbi:T9SS type A sorting domain-containing protein [Pedobacter cryophilus]|uniref:T9SS type A sorting domain-containing protein n=1 Tax=Pedobacter cryophilus TaxID=2571271 RepID=A0A4V5NXC2_9SPHI|nr:T9SS type A sorting domain-containing protein [Pedobacter cryophilus]TKB98683.1 T9SS type A sorting domain-containing protein [Pedobacter cryophilus]
MMRKLLLKQNLLIKKLSISLFALIISTNTFGQSPEIFSTAGTYSWVCPTGVTTLQVECWGAGGSGGSATAAVGRAGGGGGGGSYVKNNFSVTPGVSYTIIVGAGGLQGLTTSAGVNGNPGGKSEFSGPSISTLTASGGAAGSGATSQNQSGPGGLLGGVYGVNITSSGTANSGTSSAITTISGGGGSGATANTSLSTGVLSYITMTSQGSGYTSVPTVTINGDGTASAVVNFDIDAGASLVTKGVSGSNGVLSTGGGAGGAGGNGGAGGAINNVQGTVGAVGIAPGGGGSGGYASASSAKGGAGAVGKVILTYPVTLPVSLTSFSAQKQSLSVQLKWTTASEANNSHFDVERSADGKVFNSIGRKSGAGNSNTIIDYSFSDHHPAAGTNYYRLNQVDLDGKATLSNPISVNMGFEGLAMQIFSSSNASDLKINIAADKESSGQFIIYTVSGQKIVEQSLSLTKGNNDFSISMPDLGSGVYIATYKNETQSINKKFVR